MQNKTCIVYKIWIIEIEVLNIVFKLSVLVNVSYIVIPTCHTKKQNMASPAMGHALGHGPLEFSCIYANL
jgi:hypothetical protein